MGGTGILPSGSHGKHFWVRAQPSETGVKIGRLTAGILAVAALGAVAVAATTQTARPAPRPGNGAGALIDFEVQIRPLLSEHCLECHSQDKRKGGLSLATYADALDGGRNGAVDPARQQRAQPAHRIGVTGAVEPQMPKDEDPPLDAAEIALLRRWIDQGARATPTSPPAPPPWEAPLALDASRGAGRRLGRVDRARSIASSRPICAKQRRASRRSCPTRCSRAAPTSTSWGLLPTPDAAAGVPRRPRPGQARARWSRALLADNQKYAEHWISFWNDLLRNEDGVTYFSETAGRKSITTGCSPALEANLPYDRVRREAAQSGSAGRSRRLPDRRELARRDERRGDAVDAGVAEHRAGLPRRQPQVQRLPRQLRQQVEAEGRVRARGLLLAEPKLQLYRCDVAQDRYAEPGFLFPELSRAPASASLADRRAAAAAIFTDPRNGRLPRTLVNRVWQRLLGHGIVANPDEMDGKPWSPALLDWLASDFVEHGYDVKHLIATILTSRAYQMPAVARTGEPPARGYVFAGPEVRRLTAEQFADAIGSITGEWNVYPGAGRRRPAGAATGSPCRRCRRRGDLRREWRVASTT